MTRNDDDDDDADEDDEDDENDYGGDDEINPDTATSSGFQSQKLSVCQPFITMRLQRH